MVRLLQETPARIVEKDGTIHYGTFRTPFRKANMEDAPLYTLSAPRIWRNFRLKEWQHFGVIMPDCYFGTVIFDAKMAGISFFYLYDRLQNSRFEHQRQVSGKSISVAGQVYQDSCFFEAKGYRIHFENRLDEGWHRIRIDIDQNGSLPPVQGEVMVYEDLNKIEPLVQVSPISPNRPFYTHKAAAPASGRLQVGKREILLEREACIALFDEQKTYYPYVAFWKWATAAGYSQDGKLLAFNLCQNMMDDDEDFNENCFWMDGKISCLKAARFEYSEVLKPWKIHTNDGLLDLFFIPAGERAQKLSAAGLVRSDFHQPFGLYRGSFTDDRGINFPFENMFGLAEHHVTRY
jgi:hypothetical protein